MKRAGFALVELMVVVALVSLLAAIAIPSNLRARQNVQDTQVQADLRAIYAGITMFETVNNREPMSWTDLVPGYVTIPNVEGKYDFVVN